MGRVKTHEVFVEEINDKFNGIIAVSGKYIGRRNKIDFICNRCGNVFITTPESILHTISGCPECANIERKRHAKETYLNTKEKFIDFCPDAVEFWDYEKNKDIDIKELSLHSPYKAKWHCNKCGYDWKSRIADMANGKRNCPKCYESNAPDNIIKNRLKENGSFVDRFPTLLSEWDYDNNQNVNPFNILPKSNKKYYWKCQTCGYVWKTTVAHRVEGESCPECDRHSKSRLQCFIENYINEKYNYMLLHEHKCNIKCINPKTGYRLPYDNELIIGNNIKLIIECNGQQHYEICGWTYSEAKNRNISAEQVLSDLQWRDEYKKQYALSQGYYYLAIPYTAERNDEYKHLIDETINKILQGNMSLLPKE